MSNIGIMQGRLTEPKGRGIQFFPFENWENEFYDAADLGLQEIEFIFDFENYIENPLWIESGIKKIKKVIADTNVKVNLVCFDYFMRRPFYKEENSENKTKIKDENKEILNTIVHSAEEIGATLIEIPLVDNSSIKTDEEEELFREFVLEIQSENSKSQICFGLETDFEPHRFKNYLDTFQSDRIFANYDSGNSSGLGYNQYEEITTLNKYIRNIHIKDRVYMGTTVELGTGSADFNRMFRGIKEIGYNGSYILQAARGADGNEKENIKEQINFLKKYVESK